MRKLINRLTIVAIIVLVIFPSCNQKKQTSIGFLIPTFEVARYSMDRDYFTAKATELGAEVVVADAENDDKKQIAQATEMIDNGIDAIVIIAVNQNTAAAIVRYAKSKKVPVIAYNRMIQNAELDFLIAVDIVGFGRQMAEYAVKHKPEGNYIIVSGDRSDFSSVQTHKGQMEVLKPYIDSKKINVVFDIFIEDWMPEEARFYISEYFKLSPDVPVAILSGNDGMAGGIIEVLEQNNMAGKILVTGLDAELKACQRIVAGTQTMSIYMPIKEQAYAAAKIAVELINKRKPTYDVLSFNGRVEVPTHYLRTIAVDKDNIANTVIADGFHSESDIFGK